MRTPFAVVAVVTLLAAAAFAGTRWVETSGGIPTAPTDGIGLADSATYGGPLPITAVRASVRFTDGGTIMGGTLVPYYYDSAIGQWVEAKDADQCALATSKLVDGGSRRVQVCEWTVQARFGRAAVAAKLLVGEDAGPVTGIIRLEGYGVNVQSQNGSAQ
jgi:hypothetical protein